MDTWAWVHGVSRDLRDSGHHRTADLIWQISDDIFQTARVQAALPEAVASARALKNDWLEVYFRHWAMQSRVFGPKDAESALSEAVSLFEFAHRPETIDCPQSICVTQDLTLCYANVDGPGYAEARLDVLRETLDRITVEWGCFTCLSVEYAGALIDAGQPLEALEFLTAQAALLQAGGHKLRWDFPYTEAIALCDAGRLDEALQALQLSDRSEDGKERKYTQDRAIRRANILARQGRIAEAAEALPEFSALVPHSWPGWTEAAELLAAADPARNNWRLAACLQKCLDHADGTGAHHDAVQLGLRQARLALGRRVPWIAREALDRAAHHLAKLRKPEAPGLALAELQRQVEASPAQALPMPAAAGDLPGWLRDNPAADPEQAVEWLSAACRDLPHDGTLAELRASALLACGRDDAARTELWHFVCANPGTDGPNFTLMVNLLEHGKLAELEELAGRVEAANPAAALWFRAQLAWQRGDVPETATLTEQLVAMLPDARGARALWAEAAVKRGDLATALRVRHELCALDPENSAAIWNLIAIASAAEDWPAVRAAASQLGMKFASAAGEIDEDWGRAHIRFDEGGEANTYFAIRTGPATARIIRPAIPPAPQHADDWVAFDATLLEPRPASEAERASFIPSFRAIHVIRSGGYGESCFIDGASPDDRQFQAFLKAIGGAGWRYWITSGEDYTVTHPETGEAIPGRYFWVAAPARLSPHEVDRRLTELTAGWTHPVAWALYAKRSGLPTERHTAIAERYGL